MRKMFLMMVAALAVMTAGAAEVYIDIPGKPTVYCSNAQIIPMDGMVKIVTPWATYTTSWARVVVVEHNTSEAKPRGGSR